MPDRKGRPRPRRAPAAEAPFVAKVVSDPANPPRVVYFEGYPGDSPEKGHFRVYLDAGLARYLDVPGAALRHAEPAGRGRGLPGLGCFWVDQDAECLHGSATMRPWKGRIAPGFLHPGGYPRTVYFAGGDTIIAGCQETPVQSATRGYCTCGGPACPPNPKATGPYACPTNGPWCHADPRTPRPPWWAY